jgi:hypothetical protein
VTYVVHASVLAEDNNYDFHRNVALVIHAELERRCTNVHVTGINVQAKNFHLWPRKTAPAIRHAEPAQFQTTLLPGESREALRTEIKAMVDDALVQFGVHQFRDQDLHEVMGVHRIVRTLRNMTAEDARTLLLEVLDLDGREQGQRKGIHAIVVASILRDLRAQPDEWFQALVENARLAGHL